MGTSTLSLFRALFPSWKFFNEVGFKSEFSVRFKNSPWQTWQPQYRRGFMGIFRNGEGNLALAQVSLLERAVSEISSSPSAAAFAETVTYRLLQEWAHKLVREAGGPDQAGFQFRIRIVDATDPAAEIQDVLISAEHPFES